MFELHAAINRKQASINKIPLIEEEAYPANPEIIWLE